MTIRGKRFLLTASALGLILAGAGPALAQNHGGGGGGGHSGGGGGHGGGGGGAHLTGGGHVSAGYGGAHFSGSPHYAGSGHVGSYGGYANHGGYPAAYHGAGAAYHGSYGGHAGYGYPGHYYGHGYSTGAYWRGGYWHGGFWPRCYYGVGFAWFLPVLPLAYATYWWSGVPYYYANDVYYTWNPDYQGYVATDPPPVTESGSAVSPSDAPPPDGGSPPPNGAPAQIFMYPKNGQSTEQQAQDRAECQQWATQQAGSVAQNGPDYNRAMVACVEGRGYSAR
jgi:hypothetical protein